MRYASRLQHYLALKNEIFSGTLRAFYKNAKFFTTVRYGTLWYATIQYATELRTNSDTLLYIIFKKSLRPLIIINLSE
jgi:hypothetical protein